MQTARLLALAALLGTGVACSDPAVAPGGSGGSGGTSAGSGGAEPPTGSGGTTGSGGAINEGSGGNSAAVDTGVVPTDGAATTDAPAPTTDAASAGPFTCTLVLGAFQTSQWYDAGFEAAVGTERWEIKAAHNVWTETWANLNDAVWNMPTVSPCASNATTPDRIVLIIYKNFMTAMPPAATVWKPEISKAAMNVKTKYPSVKQIELITLVRGPNNQLCPGNTSRNISVAPEIDAAIQETADESGGLVKVGPKAYAPDCSMFEPNITTLTAAGAKAVAPMMIEYYKAHP